MKREYPVFYEKISLWFVSPLIALWLCVYVQHMVYASATEAYTVGVGAFGMTAGLSGVCFAMAAVTDSSKWPACYAGEKFLHSALLLIQTLLIVSIRDAIIQLKFAQEHPMLTPFVKGISAALMLIVATAAVWTWHHGFSELNKTLWKNWEKRIREINSANQRDKGEIAIPSPSRCVESTDGKPPEADQPS